nr:probable RNA polymerase II nuclear localization protein SLC7A6OS [Pogona vitticeps]
MGPTPVAMERAAVLRVKRKRGGPSPAEALLLACKRLRTEEGAASAGGDGVEKNLFKLVATVASENEPVQKYVQEAIVKEKAAQLLRPSLGSAQRIMKDIRSSKQSKRQESRYRLVASHRPDFTDGESAVAAEADAEASDLDIVQEEDVEQDIGLQKSGDPEVILCNAVEMIRQHLTVSENSKAVTDIAIEEEYVYDIYYMETASPGWIENILSVQPYTQDYELVDEDRIPEEMYEDEDDENSENNWRNDYPDEDDFLPDDNEDESDRGSVSDEDSGYVRRTWERYQADVVREFEYDGLEELDSD